MTGLDLEIPATTAGSEDLLRQLASHPRQQSGKLALVTGRVRQVDAETVRARSRPRVRVQGLCGPHGRGVTVDASA